MRYLKRCIFIMLSLFTLLFAGCKREGVLPDVKSAAEPINAHKKVNALVKNATGGICPSLITQMSTAELTTFLDEFETTNALYIRIDLPWSVIQPTNSTTWNFTDYDRVINAITARGFKLLVIPTYCPSWANGGFDDDKYPPNAAHATNWYNFVKKCADRYIPKGVLAWEMWNEPNINGFWQPASNVANYTNIVLKNGANAVRASATALGVTATVVTGGLSPAATDGVNINPVDFLTGIYANGGKSYLDAVGHHPYCFPEAPYSSSVYSAFNLTPDLYQVMVNNADGAKKIWGTEFGYHTGNADIGGVTQAQQAQYVTDAYNRWRSWSYTGPLMWYDYQDLGTDPTDREQNFGLKLFNGTNKPAWQSYKNAMGAATPTTYYKIQSRSQTTQYLYDGGTRTKYGTGTGDAYLWSLETYEGFNRIKNKATGEYINAENGPTNLNCTAIQDDALSSHFTITTVFANWKSIKCRWTSNFVNNKDQLGYAECDLTTVPTNTSNLWSQWNLITQ